MSDTDSNAVPAVLYAAKSTADEHGSIPSQLADGRRLAEREGWMVVAEYSDEAFSAYHGDRGPGLANAREHATRLAAERGRCVLVAQHSDRFARGDGIQAQHLAELWFASRRAGIELHSVQDDSTFTNPLLAVALGERNAEDSRRKALAVKDGMKRRRTKGLHAGGPRKLGYEYVRDEYGRTVADKPLRPHPLEALIVERIYRDYDAGISQMGIQRALNAENVPTLRGGPWHQGTIAKILADPFYKGFIRNGDGLVQGQHEPIIDLDLWERVAALRQQARRHLGRTGGRPANAKFLFTNGHLRCGRCGGAMVPRTALRKSPTGGTRGKEYEAYRCYTRIRDLNGCDQRSLPRAAVDAAALRTLTERGISIQKTRAQIAQALQRQQAEAQARLNDALAEEQRAAQRLTKIERDYTDGELSARSYDRLSARLADELEAARAQRAQAELHAAELSATDNEIGDAALGALSDVHEAIAAFVADARQLDELRLRLRQLFGVQLGLSGGQAGRGMTPLA